MDATLAAGVGHDGAASGAQLERIEMAWTDHGEVSMVERSDGADPEPLGYCDDRRVHEVESQIGVALDQIQTAGPIRLSQIHHSEVTGGGHAQEVGLGAGSEAVEDQPGALGDHRDR